MEIDNFKTIVKGVIEEQGKGLLYMYLIIDNCGKIIGRVNLLAIIRGTLNKAELGYRMGEKNQGKGHGTNAVRLVLDQAVKNHKLHRIEAGTSPNNRGSQVVLINNGFQFAGRYNEYIYQNGKWNDSINFEKILD